jgi:hypothetical protein
MSPYINKRSANILLNWCKEKYGSSHYQNIKTLKVSLDPDLATLGQYFPYPNEIVINPKRHRSLLQWCGTMIHEYTHFTQDMRKYLEYRNSYEKHPYEITCNNRADRDRIEARRFVLEKLKHTK